MGLQITDGRDLFAVDIDRKYHEKNIISGKYAHQQRCFVGCVVGHRNTTAVRFELTQVTLMDFKSIALTTRPSCHENIPTID